MGSLTCEKCGTANPSNVQFCKQCGARFSATKRKNQVCSKCGFANPPDATHCKQCHLNLSVVWDPEAWDAEARENLKQQPSSKAENTVRDQPSSRSTRSYRIPLQQKYGALRGIASFCRLMGFIFVGLYGLAALYGIYTLFARSFFGGLGIIIGAAIGAGIAYIFWNIIAEGISVLLDIEENTGQIALLLQRNS